MKTKQYSSSMFIFSLLAWSLIPSNCRASVEVDGIYYDLDSSTSTASVTSNSNKYSGDIVIPSGIDFEGNSYCVTSIGGSAFSECTGLTSVTIPNSVTSISEYAFNGCSGLTSVSIPNEVIGIGNRAYSGCTGLTSVTIPNSVTRIGDGAFSACSSLASVAIPNSVTRIGDGAFSSCSDLTSVTIPNSVTSIAYATFSECSSLASVDIPNSVTSIGSYAFQRCGSLTSVEIPNSVTSIGGEAFALCESLKSLTIPNSVTSIGNGSFCYCTGLNSITVDTGNINFDSRDNCNAIIEKSTNTLVLGCKNTVIPNSVTSIGANAFLGCSGLTSVIIPNSVTTIGSQAFCDCNHLTAIMVEKEIPISIDRYTFSYAYISTCTLYVPAGCKTAYQRASWWSDFKKIEEYDVETDVLDTGSCGDNVTYIISKDKSMVISGTGAMWPYSSPSYINDGYYKFIQRVIIEDGVTSIGYEAFKGCEGLISVEFPNSVTNISDLAFFGCAGLTSVTIPNSVSSIGSSFSGCTGLTSVTIPNSVTSIGSSAFSGCTGLASIIVESETPASIGLSTFSNVDKSNCTLYVPTGSKTAYVSATGWSEFQNIVEYTPAPEVLATGLCGDNVTYTIYSDMTMVISGTGALDDCNLYVLTNGYFESIREVIIQEGITSIDNQVFSGWPNLGIVNIPNSVAYIGDHSFSCCPFLNTVSMGNGVTTIGNSAFYGCTNLNSIDIPNSVTTIGQLAFSSSGLGSVTIPSSVTSIGECAFEFCTDLTSVIIPSNLTMIGAGAFDETTWYNCQPDGLLYINNVAYSYVGMMPQGTEIIIMDGTVSVSGRAFYECSNLVSVRIPSSVSYIGDGAFGDCTGLASITLENATPISIANGVFYNVDKTSCKLYVPAGSKSAYESASGWSEFENIVEYTPAPAVLATGSCGDNVTYTIYSDMSMVVSGTGRMMDYPYDAHINDEYFQSIQEVIIKEGVTTIGDLAFSGCTSLSSVTIPNSVTSIGNEAFYGCTGLTSVMIPNSVTSIGDWAFYGCSGLTSIEIPNSMTNVGNRAFYGCTGLTSVTIPNSVTSIDNYAFYGCSGLTSIDIPNSVTSINRCAFYGCTGLTSVTIPNSVTEIGEYAFYGCTSLNSIIIPNSVANIGGSAFSYCAGLISMLVDANNQEFDSRDNCNAIIATSANALIAGCENTVIPNSVTSIGDWAFQGCTGLTSIEIPNSVTTIDSYAFSGCTSLNSIIIPNSVTNIRNSAFDGCTGLISVTISNSVTSIVSAFNGCTGLTSIIVERKTPPFVNRNTFYRVNKTNCTLYVPVGSKSAYKNANFWNEFENIVEVEFDTDISALDNAIYVEQTEGRIGGTKDISVKMKNDFDVRGFQFTMELPEGTTIHSWTLNQDRMPAGTTMNKVFSTENIDGNKINVVCALNDGLKTFIGNDGAIATVNVTFAEDMEEGTYPIYLTDVSISDASAEHQLELSDIKATLILEDYVLGDTNGDGKVLVGDVISILNYIVGFPSENFNAKAADVNGDGKVLVGDVIAVLNIIVNQ